MNLIRSLSFLLISLLVFCSCAGSVPGHGIYYWQRTIHNFQNTYIKFEFSNLMYEKQSKVRNIKIYSFFAFFDDVNPFLLTPGSIHPESDYWEGYYNDIKSLPFEIKENIRFVFMEGCEYRMPTTSGKVKYLFSFNTSGYAGKLRTEIDLPPNHSIRLSFKEKGIPYPDAKTIGERLANDRSRYDWYEIISTIEPTPDSDPIKPCEVKKDAPKSE